MEKRVRLIFLVLLLLLLPQYALASNLGFFGDRPGAYFSAEDSRLFKETLNDTLENKPDRKVQRWNNPETGHHGKIVVLKTYEKNGMNCRQLKAFNNAGGKTGTLVFPFCKISSGEWKIAQ